MGHPKWDILSPYFFFFGGGAIFMAVPPPLTNNTTKTSVEDLVKMCPAVAEQSHQKKRKQNKP